MNILTLLKQCLAKGVEIRLVDDKLKVDARAGALQPEDLQLLKERKQDILQVFADFGISSTKQFEVLSFPQQRLWLLDQLGGGTVQYNIPSALRLSGRLDLAALNRAFTTIFARHEALRTCFLAGPDGDPYQVIRPAPQVEVAVEVVADASLLHAQVAAEASRPFDLGADLMLRARLFQLGADEHVLTVTMHHIAADGWSMAILVNEFCALYAACSQGQGDPLPPLAIQYADYAHWQRDWLQGEVLDEQLGYWERQLASLPAVHGLPLDRARPQQQTFAGATHYSQIDTATSTALAGLCQRHGATLFMGLHAAFAALLSRYSNETDIVIGTPVANRDQSEVANLIGFFVNTLVLRCDLSDSPSFSKLVEQSKSMLLDAYAHQQVPFEQIVERLNPQRSMSHSTLFQVMLIMQNNEQGTLSLPGLELAPLEQSANAAKYELTLTAAQGADGLSLAWEFNTDLFDAPTIARMAAHFGVLLRGLVAAPDAGLSSVDMVSAEERRQLLVDFNPGASDYDRNQGTATMFEAQALARPEAPALVFDGCTMTFSTLNKKANQLAHYLREKRMVGPDAMVGVCMERSPEMVVAMLAIHKAGGAYVPLDPEYPAARLAYMLADAKLDTVITQADVLARVPVSQSQALCIDALDVQAALDGFQHDNPVASADSRQLAYVIYTSGSTGNPKGVMVEQAQLVNFLASMRERPGFSAADRLLAVTSTSFDIHGLEIFLPLVTGGTLVLASRAATLDPAMLMDLMTEHEVTVMQATPATWKLLTDAQWKPQAAFKALCGGEALSLPLARALLDAGTELWNMYGPTETTIWSSCEQVLPQHEQVMLGRAIANTQFYVVQPDQLRLTPVGVAGELLIGGDGVTRGYLQRPELTAEKFIANPFKGVDGHAGGDRVYRTGDLVRWLPDGELAYLGRIDSQVKVRGFRIELGEVENALLAQHTVRDAVVVARASASGDNQLVAYIVGEAVDVGQLRTALAARLPDYMVPTLFMALDQLPLTPNGKVDRKALPQPDLTALQAAFVAPSSATEQAIASVWQDVLGVERVGAGDNFFQLGGHSLLVMQVIARLQKAGVAVTVRQMFAGATLADLAHAVDSAVHVPAFAAPANLIPPNCSHIKPEMLPLVALTEEEIAHIVRQVQGGSANVQDIYPLGPLQEGILFHTMSSARDPYILSTIFKVSGTAAVAEFSEALQRIIARHDVLRTAVLWDGLAAPVQVVLRQVDMPVSWVEGSEDPLAALKAPALQHMDLGRPSLLKLVISRQSNTDTHFVLIQLHHIVSDHVGLDIIQREFAAYRMGRWDSLPAPAPYRDFVAHALHQAHAGDAAAFFKARIGDVDEATAPFNLLNVQGDGTAIAEFRSVLPAQVGAALRAKAREMKVSSAALFHAAWAIVVGACAGRDDVVFGTVVSGRLQGTAGAENMMGVFINTLPLRVQLAGQSVEQCVRGVHDGLIELLPYEQASLALAQRSTRLTGGTPLFSALLNYRHAGSAAPGDAVFEHVSTEERTNYPLTLSIDDFGDSFALDIQVDASLDAERISAYMQTAVAALVESLARNPQRNVAALSILPEQERAVLLSDWNDTDRDFPSDACMHETFEKQASLAPDAVAVIFGDVELTYGQLNARANQLAHYLRTERSVSADTMVGICMERSIEMVVAIVGILKAGAAYVPLDPEYPAARLAYMFDNASLDTIITQRGVNAPVSIQQALYLDDPALLLQPEDNPDSGVTPRNLAYVIYTSGSTGQPKGVMVEHRALVNRIDWMDREYGCTAQDRVLQKTPFGFDVSVWEFVWPLAKGATLVMAKPGGHRDPAYLAEIIQQQITKMHFVPSMLGSMMALADLSKCTSLKQVFCSGEALTLQHVRSFRLFAPHAQLHNLYGPTEAAIDVSYWDCSQTLDGLASVPIGRPIQNIELHVLDAGLKLAPLGAAGELHIGGVGLARGYVNRPDLTAERFIAHPFKDGARLYKTGDLVRWLPDGNIEYLGRIDHQVKLRGFRIELGEIENALALIDGVKEAVVVAKDSPAGDKRLVAYVSGDDTQDGFVDRLRATLAQSLPDYMVPSAFVVLDKLPLTPNGKVDRNALPELDLAGHLAAYVAPNTALEAMLCDVWQDVLGLEQVGIHDNFFQLGGHSLLVMQVIARVQKQGVTMTARQLFASPTVAALAEAIDGSDAAPAFVAPANLIPAAADAITPDMLNLVSLSDGDIAHIVDTVPGGARNIQDIYPLGPLQEGILFHHTMNSGGDPYILSTMFKVPGEEAVAGLTAAIEFVIARHDVLRTAILWDGLASPVQVVLREVSTPVSWIAGGRDALAALQAPDRQRMDLTRPSLLKMIIAPDGTSNDHFVLVQLHHIVSDHVGLEIIQREIGMYQAGHAAALPAPVPYREFVAHTMHQRATNDTEAFFTAVLGDVDEPTAPFNIIDVQGDGSMVDEVRAPLAVEISRALREGARKLAVSPAALFHTAWAMVVGACAGREDVVFGTVVSGRLQGMVGAENMMGVFINTLPLRVRLAGRSVTQCVQETHETLVSMLPYEQTPLALAQRCTSLAGGTPLFSAMLNYRHSLPAGRGDDSIEHIASQERTSYALTLSVDDLGDGFTLEVQAVPGLDASRILAYVQTAVTGLVDGLTVAPERTMAAILVLPIAESAQLLTQWNDTARDFPSGACMHELFEEQASLAPDAVAVVFDDVELTYGQLNARANQLAHYLRAERGVGPDAMVGICMERSIEMVVAIVGILKAGAAYVPLDPEYPAARLAYMFENAGLDTVITQRGVNAPVSVEQALYLDDPALASQPDTNPESGVTPENLAYVIYTSGSTGQPKGVMVEHRALVNRIDWMDREYGCTAQDRVLQKTPFGFDVSVWEFVWPLAKGATLVMAKPGGHRDPAYLAEIIQQQNITKMHFVPSMLGSMMALADLSKCTALKQVFCSGEALTLQHVHSFRLCAPHAQLHNLYGPTEAAIDVSYWDCGQSLDGLASVPIGRPIQNIELHVLDADLKLAPLGAAGELHIGGVGLARGYVNRPDLTAERFIPHPFKDGARLYKTGDLVRWLPDGNIEYLGRIDHQVKLRGFRIELGEIENALALIDGVKEAVVVAKDSPAGDKRLVAYVSGDDTQEGFADRLRATLAQSLPDYMVPSAFVVLDVLPLTPNGKVDRKALPELDLAGHLAAYVAPNTALEAMLCDVWQDVLGLEQVGIHDNFFQLGGHSLLVMQVIARVQKQGVTMTARQLFASPTVAALAEAIDLSDTAPAFVAPANLIPADAGAITSDMLTLVSLSDRDLAHIVAKVPGGARNIQDIYPLAPLQEGILFLHTMNTGGDPYILSNMFKVRGEEAVSELGEALRFVVARHDVLRTAIMWEGLSRPVQVVHREVPLPVSHVEGGMAALVAMRAPERQVMDLTQPSLLKMYVAREEGSEHHYVLVQLHHVIADHEGLEILRREFGMFHKGQQHLLPAPVPFREFVAHTLHQAEHNDAAAYFSATIGDVEEPTAPFNLVNIQSEGNTIAEARGSLPAAVGVALRTVAREMQVSPASLLHTAWAMVVGLCSGRDDVVFGTVVSGRLQGTIGAENMMGVFVNTLPLRVKMAGQGAAQCVRQVHAALLDMLPYEQASLALAQRCTRLPGGTPLFSAMMNYRHSVVGEQVESGFELVSRHERTNYPFILSVDDLGTGFDLEVQVDSSLSAERIALFVQTAVASLVDALQSQPAAGISGLPILPASEVEQLLVQGSSTAVDLDRALCMHQLFERQAAINPGARALLHDGTELTYGELNARANELAHVLIAQRGAQPEAMIGVCMERSVDMVVAILAVLKSGAAYVPLDPAYPAARLAYMLDDASLATVITQRSLLAQTGLAPDVALCIEDAGLAAQPKTNPVVPGLDADKLAYLIYTSGSTGQPKGVMIEHRNAAAFLAWAKRTFSADQLRCVLASTSMCFDLSIFEMFAPLSTGGSLLIVRNVLELASSVHADEVTLINTVPSAAEALLQAGGFPAGARTINLAGEPLKQRTVDRLYEAGMERVYDLYGPSEDTTYSTYVLRAARGAASIGRPIDNTQVYLLNQAMRLVPAGSPGELYIGGAGLARGYLNRDDLTAEKFVASPFDGQRLYRTGDLARWLPDGNLEYLGRIDHQVKIRGFRIELGEIENALMACAGVNEAVVVARESGAGDKRLAAYIGAAENGSEFIDGLRAALALRLPDYMIPAAIVAMAQLPLTPNGKVDRKALPEPDTITQVAAYAPPATATEALLCRIWQNVLGVERVGVHDNFFQLGGHSLLVMQVIAHLQKAGVAMSARQLFGSATLATLAADIDSADTGTTAAFAAPPNLIPEGCDHITPDMLPLVALSEQEIAHVVAQVPGGAANVEDIYPLGPLQEGILFHHMMSSGGDPYILCSLFKARGEQALTELVASLRKVVARHDVLRTAFFWDQLPTPVQVVCRHADLGVNWIELEEGQDGLATIQALSAPGRQSMNLGAPSLLKLQVTRRAGSDEHFVLVQLHHIVSDHMGLEIIQREMEMIRLGQTHLLPAPVPYREFVAQAMHHARHNDADAYFTSTLGDIEDTTAPFELINVQGDGSHIAEARVAVPAATAAHLRRIARDMRISPASLFHAAWAVVVAHCSGRDDVVFGTVVSGRLQNTAGAENMLGVFINTLPLRVRLAERSVAQAVQEIHQSLLGLLPYEQASLALAQRRASLPAGAPLFSAMLNYRHTAPVPADAQAPDSPFEFIGGQERANYPFAMSVDDLGAGFELDVQVDASLDPARIAGYVQTALEGLVAALNSSPDQAIAGLRIVPPEELHTQLVEWNDTAAAFPSERCIHHLFEDMVQQHPDTIALVFGQTRLSYAELNAKANQVAHRLIAMGIRPDDRVAMCLERSSEMIVALLGVAKAGAAYVPLDPGYPDERIAYMLEDCAPAGLLTQPHLETRLGAKVPVLLLGADCAPLHAETANPDSTALGLTSRHLCYVIYTSGSTGRPKGVMVEHRSLLSTIQARLDPYPGHQQFLLITSIGFDCSMAGIFGALLSAGTVHVADAGLAMDPELLARHVLAEGITSFLCVPSLARLVLESLPQGAPHPLQIVFVGGEACPTALRDVAAALTPPLDVYNEYGPTEGSIWATGYRCGSGAHNPIPIGRPIANARVYILDARGEPVPIGVTGEIHIGGDGVARGYLFQPELTSQRFLHDPYGTSPAARMYGTGDLGRYLPDGQIEFKGRNDHQVKIRGFRIELGEIETQLLACEGVHDAVVEARRDQSGELRLVGYFVSGSDTIADPAAVREQLRTLLPEYMVPSVLVPLAALPLTAHGKVDRRALPAPDQAQQTTTEYVAPRTDTEAALAAIWQEILGVERVGVNDNFFELGGHSLLAIRVKAQVGKHFAMDLVVSELFRLQTVEELANYIDEQLVIHKNQDLQQSDQLEEMEW